MSQIDSINHWSGGGGSQSDFFLRLRPDFRFFNQLTTKLNIKKQIKQKKEVLLMQNRMENSIDACLEPNTIWNVKAKEAYNTGDIAEVLNIINRYYATLIA